MKIETLAKWVQALVVCAAAPFAHGAILPNGSIRDGDARFEVLSPTLIRLEYASDNQFEDRTTFNALDRDKCDPPRYNTYVLKGQRIIVTDQLTLTYLEGSGPFTPQNVQVRFRNGNTTMVASPTWSTAAVTFPFGSLIEAENTTSHNGAAWANKHTGIGDVNIDSVAVTALGAGFPPPGPPVASPFGTVIEAESGVLSNGLYMDNNRAGFSGPGFVAYTNAGATDTFTWDGVPADGNYSFQIRYSNGKAADSTLSVGVNGSVTGPLVMSPTPTWDTWKVASATVHLTAGSNTLALIYGPSNSANVNLDSATLTKPGAPFPPYHLGIGGYRRSLDGVDGSASTSPGLLYQDGWCLLDDTLTAIFDSRTGAVTQRSTGARTYQDGYLFVYGTNYQQALRDLHDLTGPALMLPHWAYGVWFSRYYAYSASDYENSLLPAFRTEQDPLDVLVSDTDWKAPNHWDGWEVNSQYFPDPQAYFTWAHQQGLHTSFNIHPSISSSDPAFPQAQATAQGGLMPNGGHYIFNWGAPDQLTAYFNLHYPIEADGLDIWWLDWCCNNSYATINITPDSWINYNYAKDTSRGGRRGFALSRAFSSLEAGGAYGSAPLPTGPWAEHRYTVHFTGDAYSDFGTLKYEVGYTPAEEAATGLTYTSHDLGGFHGDVLPDDLYVRWVQFGTFQPIFRLHSDHGNRLPWDYSGPARTAANKFLQLREELIPYTYTAARQAYDTGLPIVRALYLALPDQPNAFLYSGTEYYFGDNLLVAPATASGTTATTQVWLPPGNWVNYFTGQISKGSSFQSITTDWNSMPVFIKAGGIVPQRTNNVANDVQNPLTEVTINVGAGDSGSYALYEDDGDGYGFKEHAFTTTPIAYREQCGQPQLTIGRPIGHFSNQVTNRQWTARFIGVQSPSQVSVDRRTISPSSSGPGWSYDLSTLTLSVRLPSLPSSKSVTISARGQVDAGSPGAGRAKLRLNRGFPRRPRLRCHPP